MYKLDTPLSRKRTKRCFWMTAPIPPPVPDSTLPARVLDRYRGPAVDATAGAVAACSISSRLLVGERVMVAGVTDPPTGVVESLVKAAGAEVRFCTCVLFSAVVAVYCCMCMYLSLSGCRCL